MARVTRRGLIFLISLLVLLTVLLLSVVLPFLPFVFFALFSAFLVWPLYHRLAKRIRPRIAAAVLVLGVYAVLFVPLVLLALSLIGDVRSLVQRIHADGADSVLHGLLGGVLPPDTTDALVAWLVTALAEGAQALAPRLIGHFLDALLGFFIFGFVLYYSLLHGADLVAFVRGLVPLRRFRIDRLFGQIGSSLNAVFYGVLIVAVVQGTAGGIVWWIAGLPNPFFYGAIMFVLSILPFAGPSFLLLPVAIWNFAQGHVGLGIFLALSAVIFVGGIDNVSRPFLVARFGKINPALVVVGLAGGLIAFGIAGVVLGPLIFALWVGVARELRSELIIWKVEALDEPLPPEDQARAAAEAEAEAAAEAEEALEIREARAAEAVEKAEAEGAAAAKEAKDAAREKGR